MTKKTATIGGQPSVQANGTLYGETTGAAEPGKLTKGTVTILIPAKNEAAGIRQTLRAIPLERLRELGYEPHVLVVDGNSTDGTPELARAEGALVLTKNGGGKGADFRRVLPEIQTDFIVMLDADGTYPADAIPEFVMHVGNGADVVMGSRFLEPDSIEAGAMSRTNRIGNWGLSLMASLLYGQRTTDVCTGMWGFKRTAIQRLKLNSRHFEMEAELFAQSLKAGLVVQEVPIQYRARQGESKLGGVRTGMRIAGKLMRKRFVR